MYQDHPITVVPMLVFLTHQKMHLPFAIERLNPSKYLITVTGTHKCFQMLAQPNVSTIAMWRKPEPTGNPDRTVNIPEEDIVDKFKVAVDWIE